jgi:protein SCO1/2
MKPNQRQAILAILVLLLPLLVYTFFRNFSRQIFKPVAYAYDLAANGDTIYYTVPNFTLMDEKGQPFTQENLQGGLHLITFFTPNPQDSLTAIIQKVAAGNIQYDFYDNAEKLPFVKVLFISTTPLSPAALKSLRATQTVEPERWIFASGSRETVWKLAKESFHLPEFEGKDTTAAPFAVAHAVLVDKKGRVRGFWDKYDKVLKNNYETTQAGIRGTTTLKEDLRAILMTEYKDEVEKSKPRR